MESLILHKLETLPLLTYAVIFFGMTVEGEGTLLATFFSAYEGFIKMPIALSVALMGLIIGDIAWYYSGSLLERFLPAKWVLGKNVGFIDRELARRPHTIFFITKFLPYINRLTIVRARQVPLSPKTFIVHDLAAGIVWFLILVILGASFSASFDLFKRYLHFAEIGLVLVIAGFFTLEYLFSRYVRRKLTTND